MHLYRTVVFILNLLMPLWCVLGQDLADFSVTNYNSDNGLPQTSVGNVVMDKNGFLWLATQGGLVRFDGKQFVTYNRLNVPSLSSNRILKVALRSDSIVYFTDENAHFFSFDEENRAVRLPFEDFNKAIIVHSQHSYFDIIKNLAKADRKMVESVIPSALAAISYIPVRKNEGYLWIHPKAVFYLSAGKVKFGVNLMDDKSDRLTSNFSVFDGGLYCMNVESRLFRIDRRGARTEVFLQVWDHGRWRSEPTTDMFLHRTQRGLVAYRQGRFYKPVRVEGNQLFCTLILDMPGLENVNSYEYFPKQDIHVVGTSTKGVFIFKPKQFRVATISGTDNIFYGQAPYGRDAVLTSLGITPNVRPAPNAPFPLVRQGSIIQDPDGRYWVTGKNEVVFCLDSNLNIQRRIRGKVEARVFRRSTDGHLWFSTFDRKFGRISGDSVVWSKVDFETPRPNFIPVGNRQFWIADGRKLFHYNALSGRKTIVKSLEGKEVREFYFDKRKTLWLGTYGDGFYAMRNGKPLRMPLDRNGFLLFVHSFREDNRGFMWMSTNHGLFKCKVQDLYDFMAGKSEKVYYYYYDKTSGFNTNEFNGGYPPANIVLRNGQFSFPSMDGLVQFHPDSIRDVLPASGILIDHLIVDGKRQNLTRLTELAPALERVEFKIVSPYFGNAENQLLEYNIEGLGEQWYPVDAGGLIVLNRLVHGDYALRVRKQGGFGKDNVKMLIRKFTVRPFWHQTWYFRLLMLTLSFAGIYVIVRLRYFYLLKLKNMLEAQVKERTRQLEYSNKLKEKITALLAHDLQSPLHFLNVLSDHLSTALDKEQLKDVKRGTDEIRKTTSNMYAFVKEINLWAKSQQEGFFINKKAVRPDLLIEELGEFFSEMLSMKGNVLEFENPGHYALFTNREILKAVLRNLIDNSNKHTLNGKIVVSLRRNENDTLSLTVTDNGIGMAPAEVSRINRLISNVMTSEGIEQSGRLGYQIIVDFVARLHCGLEVSSEKGRGTTVSIVGLIAAVNFKPDSASGHQA
ncbi:MAG: histidine kinase [Dyadobacter sp.]|uniref:ligand-binding sensor domain-containing protein n=1 Tax=Dyadobacter sp. TaxID=1914288 RepID=UPI001B249F2F|nr:ATP-binding protein [Dyadobacter sp.]MBO9611831.1 histidine kinase [Dyadobacter sp.]